MQLPDGKRRVLVMSDIEGQPREETAMSQFPTPDALRTPGAAQLPALFVTLALVQAPPPR
jgi:hypothetical protein